jgi:GLPGLI family protein
MKPTITTLALCLMITFSTFAQQVRFTKQGEIEYEKKINMFALIKANMNKENEAYLQKFFDQYKASQPQFKTQKSVLTFSNNLTAFSPVAEETPTQNAFSYLPGFNQINVTYTDLEKKTSTIQKTVFEESFLVKDSTRKIVWKITDETREIAGYPCRRANALVMDSIYIVAFYTDRIPVSGGPESFSGLPGMILGLAMPHDHISWFATKVSDMPVAAAKLQPPGKGKAVDHKGLIATLEKAFKQWGPQAKSYLRFFLL